MSAPTNFYTIESAIQFQDLLSQDLQRVSLINFWAPWAEPCKQMNEVVAELAKKYPNVLTLQVEAEEQSEISESFDIEAVPSFVILRGHTLLDRINGADASALTTAIAKHGSPKPTHFQSTTDRAPAAAADTDNLATDDGTETPEQLVARMRKLMNQSKVVLFMKGNPETPKCGFSRKTVALLQEQKVDFAHYDILEDEPVRQGLKVLNDWPTFPQVIVNGELIGGLDILQEMVSSGELAEVLA